MEEKDLNKETSQEKSKLEWDAPKLICLDKGKTEGGDFPATNEDTALIYNTAS